MSRVIINYEDVTIEDAIFYVQAVIRNGKLSKNNTQYSYGTVFTNVAVYADITKAGSYKFRVYKR